MAEITPDQSTENYLQLLNTHEKALAAYVHTLVNDRHDAEDIIQSCKLTMWKQFARFEAGTHFIAWARKIALHEILNYRRREKRKPIVLSDPAFLEAVAAEIDRESDTLAARSDALHFCLQRLPEDQRRTILLRYYENHDIAEIASQTQRTEGAVYRLLSRIRVSLNDCVKSRLNASTT